jgi:hypothetical protein
MFTSLSTQEYTMDLIRQPLHERATARRRALCLRHARRLLLAAGAAAALQAQAAPITLDDFDAPATPRVAAKLGTKNVFFRDFTASVPGDVRELTYNLYINPLNAVAAVSLGGGQMTMAAGTGALGETVISYGAFTRPVDPNIGGPLLGIDLGSARSIELAFAGVESPLNLVVVLYTSNPLPGTEPLYYSQAAANSAPDVPGGPMTVKLDFDATNNFNYNQVDGVTVLIDRSGSARQNSYALTSLRFVD